MVTSSGEKPKLGQPPAFEEWYGVKDVPGKEREAKAAEKKVHHTQRDLGDHVSKHGCNRE